MACVTQLARPIWLGEVENSDLAIGQLDIVANPGLEGHAVWPLCTWKLLEREKVCHFGCQDSSINVERSEHPEYELRFTGSYTSFPGHYLQTEPHYRPFSQRPVFVTSASVPNAASGGPVAQGNGFVFRLTTSSSVGGGYSVCSLIADLFDARIPDEITTHLGTDLSLKNFGDAIASLGVEIKRGG